jgi:autotransporter-associated beta strand protein
VLTNTHPVTVGDNGGTIDVEGVGAAGTGQMVFGTANTLMGSTTLTVVGNGALTTTGVGNVRVTQSNPFNGNVILKNGGIFEYGNAAALDGAATFSIGNEGELAIPNLAASNVNGVTVTGGTDSVISFANGNNGVIPGTVTLNANLTVGLRDWFSPGTARSGTISGQITGAGGLIVNSGTSTNGVLTLSNSANDYAGGTTISAARVLASTSTSLGAGSVTIGGSGSELQLGPDVNIANALTINSGAGATAQAVVWVSGTNANATYSGDITINAAAASGGHFANNTGGSLLVSGKITASVPVSVRNGTVTFSNTNSSYSNLILNQGLLRLGATNAIPVGASVDIGASGNANLDLAGFDQTLASINRAGNTVSVTNNGGSTSTLTITGSATFSGAIVDGSATTAVTVAGGQLTLTGANTYSGVTTITGGTLTVNPTSQNPLLTGANGTDIQGGRVGFDYSGSGQSTPVTAVRDAINSGKIRDSLNPANKSVGYFDDTTALKVTAAVTWNGDANLDGTVNALDFNALATNFGSGTFWYQGDFDRSGTVDTADFTILSQNFNKTGGISAGALPGSIPTLGALVPEPATVSLMGLAVSAMSIRRRRR